MVRFLQNDLASLSPYVFYGSLPPLDAALIQARDLSIIPLLSYPLLFGFSWVSSIGGRLLRVYSPSVQLPILGGWSGACSLYHEVVGLWVC
jgi:hypothetical protein